MHVFLIIHKCDVDESWLFHPHDIIPVNDRWFLCSVPKTHPMKGE